MRCDICESRLGRQERERHFQIGRSKLRFCDACERAKLHLTFLESYSARDHYGNTKKRRGASKASARSECQWVIEIRRILADVGAVPDGPDRFHEFTLETPVGRLGASVYGSGLFTRFRLPQAGHVFTAGQSNPYSGKWNWHAFNPTDREYWPRLIRKALVELVEYQPAPAFKAEIDAEAAAEDIRDAKRREFFAECDRERAAQAPAA